MGDCASFEHAFSYTVPQFWGAVISIGIVCIGLLITTGQMFLRLGLAAVIIVGNSLVMKYQADIFTYILFLIAASRLYDPLSGAMSNMESDSKAMN